MINQMQHAAATANMYASAGMYDPVTLNPYANGTFKRCNQYDTLSSKHNDLINSKFRLRR